MQHFVRLEHEWSLVFRKCRFVGLKALFSDEKVFLPLSGLERDKAPSLDSLARGDGFLPRVICP